MSRARRAILFAIVLACAAGSASLSARQGSLTGSLRVVVQDPSGAVIPGALVLVRGSDAATEAIVRTDVPTDAQGVALVANLVPGRYVLEASFPGFETRIVPDVRVRSGDNNRRAVTLSIQKVDETVSVGRDPATSASDPNSDRFGTVLSKSEIEALPDDPDEMERVLKEMAGPGATIRMDGFRGGKLPPKSQIRSIRFARDMFAAENHGGGMVFVDIVTQPGMGPLRGGLDFMFRDDALNARNAFQSVEGPEQTQQYTFNLSGTLLKERTSFSLSAGGASLYDSANIFTATPNGPRGVPFRRPSDRLNFNGRLDHGLTRAHTVRVSLQKNANEQQNLGVGNFDLAERAYSRSTDDSILRFSESGPWSRNVFGESRLQVRSLSSATRSMFGLATERVLDAFTAGGAQQGGGRASREIEWAADVNWTRGKHAVRAGLLVEGGWYDSDVRTNDVGTYTFSSVEDFEAGRPATFTQRLGDPRVEYSHWQAGFYVQDDWRARKNLTLSAGVRHETQTHLSDTWSLAPRAGFTWSPFSHGRTTVRGSGGVFYDWFEPDTYEQILRVDGVRQRDLVIRNPGYPDPFAGGATQEILPPSKYAVAAALVMPRRVMFNTGISHRITPQLAVNLGYTHSEGSNRLRGRNINAPGADGQRPDPALGNITQVESTASLRSDMVNVGMNFTLPSRSTFLFANYSFINNRSDADGPFSLPASNGDLSAEWGPAAGVARHNVSGMVTTSLPGNFRVAASLAARTGQFYNITTGRDDNGDTVFNDRPAGTSRNSGQAAGMWDAAARVSYAFGFGERSATAGGGMPTMIVQRVGGGAGDMLGLGGGGGAENKRVRFEVYASVQNLFNHTNPVGFSGVMTSQLFGRPTAAMPSRRVDLGLRVGF
jgi:hypothetical protein